MLATMQSSLLSSRKCVAQRPFTAALPTTRCAVWPLVAVTQAKLSKASEFRGLSDEEINSQVAELKKELFTLRIKYAKREEYKPSDYRKIRRKVAQLLTVKRERELAEGVSRRDALGKERRRLTEAGFGNL